MAGLMMLTEKEREILQTLERSKQKLTLSDLSKKLKSNLPYTSNLVSRLEAKSLIKTVQKDGRSKYIMLDENPLSQQIPGGEAISNLELLDLSLKVVAFFTKHADDIKSELAGKLMRGLTAKERDFLNAQSDRIKEFEETW